MESQTDLYKIFINEMKRTTMYCSQIHFGPDDSELIWVHSSIVKSEVSF